MDYEVQRCTRRCSATGRELAEGEAFYSALVSDGGQVRRIDFCQQAWAGPPENSLGWWKSQIPKKEAQRAKLAPNDVLWRYFVEIEGQPELADVMYVLALLLVRRRVLKLEATDSEPTGSEIMVLYSPREETTHRVAACSPSDARVAEIQRKLQKLLFAEAE